MSGSFLSHSSSSAAAENADAAAEGGTSAPHPRRRLLNPRKAAGVWRREGRSGGRGRTPGKREDLRAAKAVGFTMDSETRVGDIVIGRIALAGDEEERAWNLGGSTICYQETLPDKN